MPNHSQPTPYRELNEVLGALTRGVQEILGDNFTGAYLQGSFAVGDFDEYSDVDFIIVVEHELSEAEVAGLQSLHPRIYALPSAWAQHLEGSYYPRNVLRQVASARRPLWYLDHGSQLLIQDRHCNTVVVRWVLREMGVTLAGPPPATLVEPIAVGALRREILADIRDWGREIMARPESFNNRFYQSFIVLSYCRMLHDLLVGWPGSKRTGAAWAKEYLDPAWRGLIDRTWAARPDPARTVRELADPQDFADTLKFVRYVTHQANVRYFSQLNVERLNKER